jgi:hypothetical protein
VGNEEWEKKGKRERERETYPSGLIGRGFFREDMHGGCSLVVA